MMPKSTRDDAPLRIDEQIALMHVGVKEAVAQGVAQEGLDQAAPQRRRIKSGAGEPVRIGQRQAVDPFHRQHFARRAVPVDLGDAKLGIVGDVLGKFGAAAASSRKSISMRTERASVSTTSTGFSRRMLGDQVFGQSRREEHVREIARKAPLDARPQDLDRDFALAVAVAHAGAMHLGDRGGGHRFAEFDEQARRASPRRPLRSSRRRLRADRASSGPAAAPAPPRPWGRRYRAGSRGTGRASHRKGQAGRSRRTGRRGRWRRAAPGDWRAPARGRASGGSACGSTSTKAPSRASTKPARASRRWPKDASDRQFHSFQPE